MQKINERYYEAIVACKEIFREWLDENYDERFRTVEDVTFTFWYDFLRGIRATKKNSFISRAAMATVLCAGCWVGESWMMPATCDCCYIFRYIRRKDSVNNIAIKEYDEDYGCCAYVYIK